MSAPDGSRVMTHDVPSDRPWSQGDDPFFLSLRGDPPAEITALQAKLAPAATVIVSLDPSRWAPLDGMSNDPFGVTWVVDIAVP